MNSVYLLRHGNYANPRNILPGRLPVELSEEGKLQIKKLGEYFKDKSIKKIYSSSVLRCKQTSEIISDNKTPIVYDKRLLETFSAYQGFWDKNWNGSEFHFYSHRHELGGESLREIQIRMANFWDQITKNLHDNLIICSHGDPLATLYAYIYKLPLMEEQTPESKIPGWINKGEFIEVQIDSGQILKRI